MAHYAFLDENNIVTSVIVGKDEGTDGVDWEQKYGEIKGQTCKRTSYNTLGNQHWNEEGNLSDTQEKTFRGNHAGIGFTYDEVNDVFIAPKPVEEGKTFELNQTTWLWEEVVE
jgi:hypothetical protein